MAQKLTSRDFQNRKGHEPLVAVTAYDFWSARAVQEAGVDFILVGDSLGMVIQGHDSTLPVTLDQMVYHTQAVVRGAPDTFVVADMPYLTFHVSPEQTISNAARLVVEGGAQAIKIEGGQRRMEMIQACLQAEIPVMGHIGLTPQSVHALGGFKVQTDREFLIKEAEAVAQAGVFALVLEGIPAEIADDITRRVPVPTIGIGAGSECNGQILVYHDVLGLHKAAVPRFVKKYADLWSQSVEALGQYTQEVRQKKFPTLDQTYKVKKTNS